MVQMLEEVLALAFAVLETSISATSFITRGRNHIRLYIDWFMSLLQQSVAAVE